MRLLKPFATVAVGLMFTGCVSSQVQRGALEGALIGGVLGAGIGELASNPDLLGPGNSVAEGKMGLSQGSAIGAGAVIGVITGAVVGAMVGHRRDEGYEPPPKLATATAPEQSSEPAGESTDKPADADKPAEQSSAADATPERAPYLRGL
jgi:hypothetical protein